MAGRVLVHTLLLYSFANETGAILSNVILPSRQHNDDLPGSTPEFVAGEYQFIEFPIRLTPCDPTLVDEWIRYQLASEADIVTAASDRDDSIEPKSESSMRLPHYSVYHAIVTAAMVLICIPPLALTYDNLTRFLAACIVSILAAFISIVSYAAGQESMRRRWEDVTDDTDDEN